MRHTAKVGLESGLSGGLAARRGRVLVSGRGPSTAPIGRRRCRTTRSIGRCVPASAGRLV